MQRDEPLAPSRDMGSQDAGWGWGPALMARPYSKDLRDRVVGSVAGGRSCRTTAALFGVSVASVVKWSQRYRATGTAAAKPMGGHRRRILRDERDWLVARIAEKPDLTFAGGAGRAGGARHGSELWRGVGVLRQRGDHVQKKACTPASRIAPTSPDGAPGGSSIKAGLTRDAWSSSTRPGPRPT